MLLSIVDLYFLEFRNTSGTILVVVFHKDNNMMQWILVWQYTTGLNTQTN